MPTGQDLHVDGLLTEISIAYRNTSYIADQIFPIVTVSKESGIVPKYDRSHWFRDGAKLATRGARAPRGDFTVDKTDKFFCDRYFWAEEIADDDIALADNPFDLERDAAELATDKIQLRRERAFATDFFTTGVWANDDTGGTEFTQWSDYANSNPLVDFTTYMDDVESRIGREANVVVIGKQVWNVLKWHPDVIDNIKFTQTGVVSEDLFRTMVGLDRLLIGRALVTTQLEGTAESSVTLSRVWGKHALFLYTPDRPSLRQPAAGYTFVWMRVPNALQYIRRLRDEERSVWIYEANSYFDQKATSTLAGTFLQNAVA
jgi:hypothetical protein